ncbi:copper transport protein YcnJ precursor [Oceanobacillus picturae]|uniref:Copper transport protein YcnJ n=1 Tax=Oceanobacillus picturae TaxID=171693 RepID=A0A0U9H4P5_9BACI|nr:copper resistance protein CopC [Oceanobacillus picturae]GAQ17307.1 copper transport protein YcnJ precursor [Oceanobacillus picturae]
MKRIFFAVALFLFITSITNSAFAHSHIEGSNPEDGEVVTEALQEIVLTFDGSIEEGSTVEVTTAEGQSIEVEEIAIDENTVTATIANSLSNGEYQVDWDIISADGHPLDGEFSFTMNAPEEETADEEETGDPAEATEDEETTESPEQSTQDQDTGTEEGSSSIVIVLVVLLVIIVAGGVMYFIKKRK